VRVAQELQGKAKAGEPFRAEYRVLDRDGRVHWFLDEAVVVRGGVARPDLLHGIILDITAQKEKGPGATSQDLRDRSDGLFSRDLFLERLGRTIVRSRRPGGRPLGVLFADLDRFRLVNEQIGHEAGDRLLAEVGGRLERCLRSDATVARLEGDGFAVLLRDLTGEEEAIRAAEGILEAFQEPVRLDPYEVLVSASIGISLGPRDLVGAEGMLREAEATMRRVKSRGRERYQVYSPEIQAHAVALLKNETFVRQALARDEFQLHFLPFVSLVDGEIVGVEALIRWEHPELGLILPGEFLGVAEESGMIVPIGEWVMRSSLAQLGAWREEGFSHLKLSVNLSARQFEQADLVRVMGQAMEEAGVPGRCLVAEITENTAMRDPDSSARILEELHSLGVEISIDDFGTGYASPEYLKMLRIDKLKIDRSFVRGVPHSAEATDMTRAIIAMAHDLNVKVIAEGVEIPKQASFLRDCRCDEMQGFLFSRPEPAQHVGTLLHEGRRLSV
jgi:diguanylate cyclase (GGDEF)-like protein